MTWAEWLDLLYFMWIMSWPPLLVILTVGGVALVVLVSFQRARRKRHLQSQSSSSSRTAMAKADTNLVGHYAKEFFRHWRNVYSVPSALIGLLTAGFTLFLPDYRVVSAILTVIFALISVIAAGYFAWKDAVLALPKPSEPTLALRALRTQFDLNMQAKSPMSHGYFGLHFEAINSGSERVLLRSIDVENFVMGTSLLGDKPKDTRLLQRIPGDSVKEIEFPLEIEPKDRELNLIFEIAVEFRHTSELEFARRLCELQNYSIDLTYSFEDIVGPLTTKKLPLRDSFEQFRNDRFNEWQNLSGTPAFATYVAEAIKGGCVKATESMRWG